MPIFVVLANGRLDVCNLSTTVDDHWDLWVEHGWLVSDWSLLTSDEQADAIEGLRPAKFRMSVNGTRHSMYESFKYIAEDDTTVNSFKFQLPFWLKGTHHIVGEWIDNGIIEFRVDAQVNFGD